MTQPFSTLIEKRKDIDALATGLKVLGWTPSVGTVSQDGVVVGYNLGVVVKIGDERIQWAPHKRSPMIDFFSIANIANGTSEALCLKPVGFEWGMAGVDSVQLNPNKREKKAIEVFVEKITKISSLGAPAPKVKTTAQMAQMGLFEMMDMPAMSVMPSVRSTPSLSALRP